MHFKWNYEPPVTNIKKAAEDLSKQLNISTILAGILINRGITDEKQAKKYFNPRLEDLLDPFMMKDMDIAVRRLSDAIGNKERIMVYGDYDVDGCSAVALVYKFLQQYYSNIEYYIPNRYDEGYGISKKGLEHALDANVRLIIILDSGIKAFEEIAYAQDNGIDVIVCDHHVPDDELPCATAILDPKRDDDPYPFKHLCGCGIGFKLVQAFAKSNGIPFNTLMPLLDFCAISIAADLVPVTGENRILAHHGLRHLSMNPTVGLKAIIDICGLENKTISMSDITFKIGPRINASGRMENGKESVDLLVEKDLSTATKIAKNIDFYNEQRKDIDKQMTDEANQIVERLRSQGDSSSIVLYDKDWKKGVIGIVASRLSEIYTRPTIVMTYDNEYVTGSARSVEGFDIYSAIKSCKDLLVNFGGHTYAAGLTMRKENLKAFKEKFQNYVEEHITPEQTEAILHVDSVIDFCDITTKFHNDLKRFAPFGPSNPKPLFCTKNVYDFGTSRVVGRKQEHIKLELVDSKSNNVMNGIAFGQSGSARYIKSKRSFDIIYSIEENIFKHGAAQLQIEDIRPADNELKNKKRD